MTTDNPDAWIVYDGPTPSPRRITGVSGWHIDAIWTVRELTNEGRYAVVAIFPDELQARRWADDESNDPSVRVVVQTWGEVMFA